MSTTLPEHHIHNNSDPLPGNRGVDPSIDYTTDAIERSGPNTTWNDKDESQFVTGQHSTREGKTAFNSERPMNVQPTAAGGVAVGGRSDLPEGHASGTDKLVGKTQKVMGKMTGNAELHEKGELRETGGKAAAQGGARAAHD